MKVKIMKLDNGKEIKQIITKEFGRKLIMKAPLSEIEYYSMASTDGSNNSKHRFFVTIMNNSMKINVLTHLTMISLFNDCCVSCGKPFTHYAIVEVNYENEKKNKKTTYTMIPCRVDYHKNGSITYESYTKDHIIPKSRFGADTMNNYQFMCKSCNLEKAHSITDEDMLYGDYNYGVFTNVKPNRCIVNFGKIKTKLIDMEHHCGGLFYIRFENSKYDGYYKPNGKNVLTEQYNIKSIQKI